jgi:U5 small nuclear ribonucleoprotein component
VHFILEPFYKVISVTISEEKKELQPVLVSNKVHLKPAEYNLDIKPLLKLVLSRMLGDIGVLADAIAQLPSALEGTETKVALTCPGDT